MALPPLTPPTSKTAAWLTADDRETIRLSILETPPGYVKLYNPDARGLRFGEPGVLESAGDDSLIHFGQVEPHFAIVSKSSPLLDPDRANSLFRMERRIVICEDTPRVYVDPDTDEEFPSKEALRAAQAARGVTERKPVASRVSQPKAPAKGRSKNQPRVTQGARVAKGPETAPEPAEPETPEA